MSNPLVPKGSTAAERLRQATMRQKFVPYARPAPKLAEPARTPALSSPPSLPLLASPEQPPVVQQNDLFRQPKTARKKAGSASAGAVKPAKAAPGSDAHREKVLKALGLPGIESMLLCVPSQYIDCRFPITSLQGMGDGSRGLYLLHKTGAVEAVDEDKKRVGCAPHQTIWEAPYQGYWSRIRQLRVELHDASGNAIWISVFNPWRQRSLPHEGPVLVEGVIREFGPRLYLTETTEPPIEQSGKVWARYVCPGAPSEADITSLLQLALETPDSWEVAEHALVTSTLLSSAQLLDVAEAACGQRWANLRSFLGALHQPESPLDGELAASAARFMAVAGICSAAKAANTRLPHPRAPVPVTGALIERLIASQPEKLTDDQLAVVSGLVDALRSPQPLTGLLSGDVGTGKTLAFLIPAVAAHMVGQPVAIVSPTEILANQVAANLAARFPMARVERVVAGGRIRDQGAILIGTSGLATVARKSGYVPSFLVVDEQHKLATKDRNSMVGPWTHLLEASATPIPRSLASTLYSGTKVFNLTTAPVKRDVHSSVIDESERECVVGWIRAALADNHRIAIIYPRVGAGAGQSTGVGSVIEAAAALEARFPGKVGMLHGKMPTEELLANLDAYRAGTTPMMVASTIMETGIDIPDIRLLIVKDAGNFGIAQLHQLRGRLARNGGSGRFVMMVKNQANTPPETSQRLDTVKRVTDGYLLAEADMESRGFGDLAGSAQTGGSACAFQLLRLSLADFEARADEIQ